MTSSHKVDATDNNDQNSDEERHSLTPEYAEISPNDRYIRFEEIISQTGKVKATYKAFDTRNGIEVAWTKINLSDVSKLEQERMTRSANYLLEIQHKYIIEWLATWTLEEPRTLNIITVKLESLKEGLDHLHTLSPPIVHRDLTCSHIYINGSTGDINIGSMWLAAVLENTAAPVSLFDSMARQSQHIGTPACIVTLPTTLLYSIDNPPESFEDKPLSSKVDIYAFGMCCIEMITRETPYSECAGNYRRIATRALRHVYPEALSMIPEPARSFIECCLRVDRPSASELLSHVFLTSDDEASGEEIVLGPRIAAPDDTPQSPPTPLKNDVNCSLSFSAISPSGTVTTIRASTQASEVDIGEVKVPVQLRIAEGHTSDGVVKEVEFVFNTAKDNYDVVAREMIDELGLLIPVEQLAALIQVQVCSVMKDVPPLQLPPAESSACSTESVILATAADYGIVITNDHAADDVTTAPPTMTVESSSTTQNNDAQAATAPLTAAPITIPSDENKSPREQLAEMQIPISESPAAASIATTQATTISSMPAVNAAQAPITIITDISSISPTALTPDLSAHPTPHTSTATPQLTQCPSQESLISASTEDSPKQRRVTVEVIADDAALVENAEVMEMLNKEKEKIEKESRAARRAFEQRIQKHKIIQETCEEDLLKRREEYTNQLSELSRKEKASVKKHEEDVQKLKEEFDAKVTALKLRRKEEKRQRALIKQQQQHNIDSTFHFLSNQHDPLAVLPHTAESHYSSAPQPHYEHPPQSHTASYTEGMGYRTHWQGQSGQQSMRQPSGDWSNAQDFSGSQH